MARDLVVTCASLQYSRPVQDSRPLAELGWLGVQAYLVEVIGERTNFLSSGTSRKSSSLNGVNRRRVRAGEIRPGQPRR